VHKILMHHTLSELHPVPRTTESLYEWFD
jgi:hypothetical protein